MKVPPVKGRVQQSGGNVANRWGHFTVAAAECCITRSADVTPPVWRTAALVPQRMEVGSFYKDDILGELKGLWDMGATGGRRMIFGQGFAFVVSCAEASI